MNLRQRPVGSIEALLITALCVVGIVLSACSSVPSPSTATHSVIAARNTPGPTVEIVRPPARGVGPAVNGLIAYSFEGDIFVGDPVTGASMAITSGPEPDINPKFSPDGTRLAFVRGTPTDGPASLIVVGADGSNERVVVPEGFGSPGLQIGVFAWTPDGSDLLVEIDFPPITYPHGDGEIGLFDASGIREPRLLVPPLTAWVGGIYFNPSAQVAPMFRPPDGDQILSQGTLKVFDADFTGERQLGGESLADYGPEGAYDPTWSPDGAWVVVSRGFDGEMSLINAEGGDLQSLGPGSWPMWSPDSSSIAFEDAGPEATMDDDMRLAVYDLASSTKRVLESSVSPLKEGAAVQTITNNVHHAWYYEGWSWSPDGRSLLLLKDHRTRPIVIDVETDTATELPWETDSFPSWQRVGVP